MRKHMGLDFGSTSTAKRFSFALLEIVEKRASQRQAAKRFAKQKRRRPSRHGLRSTSASYADLTSLGEGSLPF